MIINDSKYKDDRWVPFQGICEVDLPKKTKTYQPVPNEGLVNTVREKFTSALKMDVLDERYILSAKDQEMFGVIRLVPGEGSEFEAAEGRPFTIGLRNSYNAKVSLGIATGPSVLVCSNLCFSGEDSKYLRKHTRNVWQDVLVAIDQAAQSAQKRYSLVTDELENFKSIELSDDSANALFGVAHGRGVLTSRMLGDAMRHWNKPRYEEFEGEKNLWGWYNACTFAFGAKANARTMLRRHAQVHKFSRDLMQGARYPFLPTAAQA